MIFALAGRRVDDPAAKEARFSPSLFIPIGERIEQELRQNGATLLVAAAACGADIIALEVAGRLGIRRRVVLPADPEEFRRSSVADRPGDWGGRFDRIIAEVAAAGDLVIQDHSAGSTQNGASGDTWKRGNRDILDEAMRLGSLLTRQVRAIVVWNGQSRGDGDVTADFLAEARRRALPITEILTLK